MEIITLGGVGLFGMNMMAMRCGGQAIISRRGNGISREDTPGVDILIRFLFNRRYRDEFKP